ncbi:hypothetical protein AVEN_114994-1 [Araneus ventricosus]|uniref:Uncharacterized protein n=1 Tax=Araneus ventricosus TaxID=182803 RepID=A0A4Y1ZWU8_ARAVE|nr:hypothetical protein AVEN_114994-1 [Araneus ventricosus]
MWNILPSTFSYIPHTDGIWWPSGRGSVSPFSKGSISIKVPPYSSAGCTLNTSTTNVLLLPWSGRLEKRRPVQVLSSSSDHGSKLRGLSKNSLRIASKNGRLN